MGYLKYPLWAFIYKTFYFLNDFYPRLPLEEPPELLLPLELLPLEDLVAELDLLLDLDGE